MRRKGIYWLTALEGYGPSWYGGQRDAAEMTACREGMVARSEASWHCESPPRNQRRRRKWGWAIKTEGLPQMTHSGSQEAESGKVGALGSLPNAISFPLTLQGCAIHTQGGFLAEVRPLQMCLHRHVF